MPIEIAIDKGLCMLRLEFDFFSSDLSRFSNPPSTSLAQVNHKGNIEPVRV